MPERPRGGGGDRRRHHLSGVLPGDAPLAAPGLIALTILSTQGAWNEFMHPLIAVGGNNELRPCRWVWPLLPGAFGQAHPWNTILAGALITTIPMAIIFFAFQRYFVQGVAASGGKE